MALYLLNKLLRGNIIKKFKNQKLNIKLTVMNKYSLDCDLVQLKSHSLE